MPRLESQEIEKEALRQEIRQELEREMKKKDSWFRRKFKSLRNCFLSLLVFIFLIALGVGWMAAKLGIRDVPVLSSWVYNPPVPLRWIDISEKEKREFDSQIWLEKKISSFTEESLQMKNTKGNSEEIIIGEKELSLLFQQFLDSKREEGGEIQPSYGQVTIEPEAIELYVVFQKPTKIQTLVWVMPILNGNQISVEMKKIQFGDLPLPQAVNRFVGSLINSVLAKANEAIPKEVSLGNILLESGKLRIKNLSFSPPEEER